MGFVSSLQSDRLYHLTKVFKQSFCLFETRKMGKKIIQIREGDKGLFSSLDKDKDERITIKQLGLAMEELFGIPDDSEETEDAAHDFQSLLWSVKIDEESFFEIIEKCRLRRLLRQANHGVEESMNKLFTMMDKDGNGKVSQPEYQEWYKKVIEVDSDFEDDFDDADLKEKFESQETKRKITADFSDLDLDGDGNITMKELIAKLNPSASISEKEKLAVLVSSAPNFDLDGDGNINMREMITKLNPSASILEKEVTEPTLKKAENIILREMNTKSNPSAQEKKLTEKKEGPFDYIEMEKMYQKQFNTRERADFLKEFDLNKDGYVSMKEIKQWTQEKRADFFKDFNLDGDGNIAIKEMIATLNPPILEKKITEKNGTARRRHYGYLDPTLASKAKERSFSGVDLDVARAESK